MFKKNPLPLVKTAQFDVSEHHLMVTKNTFSTWRAMKLTFLVFNSLHRMRTFPFTFRQYFFVNQSVYFLDEISAIILLSMFPPCIVVVALPRVLLATNFKLDCWKMCKIWRKFSNRINWWMFYGTFRSRTEKNLTTR